MVYCIYNYIKWSLDNFIVIIVIIFVIVLIIIIICLDHQWQYNSVLARDITTIGNTFVTYWNIIIQTGFDRFTRPSF